MFRTLRIIWLQLVLVILLSNIVFGGNENNEYTPPPTFVSEYFLINTATSTPLQGNYDFIFEILASDNTTVLFRKDKHEYPESDDFLLSDEPELSNTIDDRPDFSQYISNGVLNIAVVDEDELDRDIFSQGVISGRITVTADDISGAYNSGLNSLQNGEESVINFEFNSLARSIVAYTSIEAERFFFDDIFYINEDISTVGVSIVTSNIKDNLNVSGSIYAQSFIGDASNVDNINYVLWQKNDIRIYYDHGNVGIGLKRPLSLLHLYESIDPLTPTAPTLLIDDGFEFNNPDKDNDDLTVKDTLFATFIGDAQDITTFNASNVEVSILDTARIRGGYTSLSGVGTLRTGTWNADIDYNNGEYIIQSEFVASAQTLETAIISDSNISGNIILTNDLIINSSQKLFEFDTVNWALKKHSSIVTINTKENLAISAPDIQYEDIMSILTTGGQNILLGDNGNVGFNIEPSAAELTLSSGFLVGNSDVDASGVIRFLDNYEGYNGTEWKRLDYSGIFTGYSLYSELSDIDEIIFVNSDGNVRINMDSAIDHLNVSGNVIFKQNDLVADISDLGDGDNFIWIANKGAIRIGKSDNESIMWDPARIGKFSAGIGYNASAPGYSAVNISYDEDETVASSSYSVIIGSNQSNITDQNSIIIASNFVESGSNLDSASSNIFLSINEGFGDELGGTNNVFLTGDSILNLYYDENNDVQHYNNAISGGSVMTPVGNDSFIWDVGYSKNFSNSSYSLDKTFLIGPNMSVGINTNDFDPINEPFVTTIVNGNVKATSFLGMGNFLTGDIHIDYLTVGDETFYATQNVTPNYIYASNFQNYLPVNSVSSMSIVSESITADNINNFSITLEDIKLGSISGEHFEDNSIGMDQLNIDDLVERVISSINATNFEDGSVNEEKIAENSLYTYHFINQAVTTTGISINVINNLTSGPQNHIANGTILNQDFFREAYENKYFANGSATSETIDHQALYTTVDSNGNITDSHFVFYDDILGTANPQIQEHHIQTNQVLSKHIPTDNINTRIILFSNIYHEDLTYNAQENYLCDTISNCVATDRTVVSQNVFQDHHFGLDALTTDKFWDDPTANFQLSYEKIASGAVNSDEIADAQIFNEHIEDYALQGDHFIPSSITSEKFSDDSIYGSKIQYGSIKAGHIANGEISLEKTATGSITGLNIAQGAVTSEKIVDGAISSSKIATNSIYTFIDGSLDGEIDFAPGSFTVESFQDGAITSSDLSVGPDYAITSSSFGTNNIEVTKIQNNSLNWADFPIKTGDENQEDYYMPDDILQDASLSGEKLCINEGDCQKLTSEKFADESISATNIDPTATFNVSQLVVPLAVSKGGTGLSDIENDQVIFVYEDPLDGIRMGQTEHFYLDPSYDYLRVGVTSQDFENSLYRLITSGNIMIENGVLLLAQPDDSTSTYTYVTLTDNSLQFTNATDLESSTSNMSLKVYNTHALSKVSIGTTSIDTNTATLLSGLSIGRGGYADKLAPTNGLYVPSSIQISRESIASTTHPIYSLIVEDSTSDGILTATTDNVGIILDSQQTFLMSQINLDFDSPIISDGQIDVTGKIGIDVSTSTDTNPAISILMDIDTIEAGVESKMIHSDGLCIDESCSAISSILNGIDQTGQLGYTNDQMFSGVYAYSSDESDYSAALFKGYFYAESLTDNNLPPSFNLQIDSLIVSDTLLFTTHSIVQSIDWTKGNIATLDVGGTDKTIHLLIAPNESANLFLKVTHSGIGKVSWEVPDGYTLHWLNDYPPELTNVANSIDFVIFYYSHENKTYYAGVKYDFRDPTASL